MNKLFFRILVLLMSLSLIGIILVQVYWFNTSLQNNDEQFKFHVKSVIGMLLKNFKNRKSIHITRDFNKYKDSTGKLPQKNDLLEFYYVQKNYKNNTTIVFTNSISSEDYNISSTFFDKKSDSVKFKKL